MSSSDTSPLDYSKPGTGIVIGLTLLAALTTFVVGLRVWARRLTAQPLGLDDHLCLVALLSQHVLLAGSCIALIDGGLGRDIRISATENPKSVIYLFQGIFIGELGYTYSSPLIKLSVLAFYRRIFPTPTVRLGTLILGSMCIAWCIAITILDFLQCRPLKAFWYTQLQALPTTHCLDSILCFLGNSIANSVIDFLTLTLPIREITKLKMSRRRKFNIAGVFLMGGIAFVASLVRTVSTGQIYRHGITNFTKQFAVSGVATVIEIYVAIIGACCPTLIPIYRRLRYGDAQKSQYSGGSRTKISGATPLKRTERSDGTGSFERLPSIGDGTGRRGPADHYVEQGKIGSENSTRQEYSEDGESYPLEGVMVGRTVDISRDYSKRDRLPIQRV